jgi:hypothetical protein
MQADRYVNVLYRPKGAVTHVGLEFEPNKVIHISPSNNVEILTKSAFLNSSNCRQKSVSIADYAAFIKRVEEVISPASAYSLLSWNCQDLVNYLLTGNKKSEQRNAVITGVVTGLALNSIFDAKRPVLSCFLGVIAGLAAANVSYKNQSEGCPDLSV